MLTWYMQFTESFSNFILYDPCPLPPFPKGGGAADIFSYMCILFVNAYIYIYFNIRFLFRNSAPYDPPPLAKGGGVEKGGSGMKLLKVYMNCI